MFEIKKPHNRKAIRQFSGIVYYRTKRRLDWILSDKKWAQKLGELSSQHVVFEHRSLILRPLKDVDMHLQENKRVNLELAVAHLNNRLIQPGETFSIWKLVGRPSKRKGYLEGLVLREGQISTGTGGGLCQLGNLLFWIFAHSPLSIKERFRHGFDVFPDVNRKVPFGAGATLAYNHIDLQVKNETRTHFQLKVWLDETHLRGALLASHEIEEEYSVEERNHIIKQQIWGGYSRHNQIVQIKKSADGTKEERLLVENHAIMMYNPFLENT
ncbi:MAG: VanW family protein [bacterium]|nr:VanW family protein [bacterium]